jgi:hypothetical protein
MTVIPSGISPLNKTILTTLEVIGFHQYDDAPLQVTFLSGTHRHKFIIKMYCRVLHSDRHLEFFIVRKAMKEFMDSKYEQNAHGYLFGGKSCEMIAEEILMHHKAGFNAYRVEVWEDGENAGIVEV